MLFLRKGIFQAQLQLRKALSGVKLSSEVLSADASRAVLLGAAETCDFNRKMKREVLWTHCCSLTVNISPA